jgi:soluble P-type ATPase
MTGLSDRLKAFQASLDTIFGAGKKVGTLELWDQARLIALDTDQATDPAKQVDQLDRMLREATGTRAAAAQRITQNTDQLLKMIQDGQAKIVEAAGIDEQLLAQYTSERDQALSFGRIVDDLIINQTTVGIGHPAAAPYSLGWTEGATSAASYYGNREGDQPPDAPKDLHEIAARYGAYAALIGDFAVAWKGADAHLAAALGDLTGKQKNDAEAAAFNTAMDAVADKAEALRVEGQTVMFVAVDGRVAGLLGVSDPIKQSTPEAIRQLHEEGIRIVMLTGDSRTTADAVAKKLNIDEVVAEVLPDQKSEVVKRFQQAGRIVAMAGDGINDAPALAQAHVGIAMGTGTDVAIESAGVTLVKGDLRGIVRARKLSRATMGNIKQNLFFAFVYNALGVPVAAGVLYPFFGVLLSPMIAAAAMSFSSVSVIGNALRLRRVSL